MAMTDAERIQLARARTELGWLIRDRDNHGGPVRAEDEARLRKEIAELEAKRDPS